MRAPLARRIAETAHLRVLASVTPPVVLVGAASSTGVVTYRDGTISVEVAVCRLDTASVIAKNIAAAIIAKRAEDS